MRLYLASTSPARLTLLRSAGIEPVTLAPDVDEHAVAAEAARVLGAPLTPHHVVELLARAKAEAVSLAGTGSEPIDGLILGGDSVFVIDGVIYGKPHTPEKARERWHLQRGRTGQLFSGHWLIEQVKGARAGGRRGRRCRRHLRRRHRRRRARRVHRHRRAALRGGRLHDRQPRCPVHHPDLR